MSKLNKIAGVVVLYNPTDKVVSNILSYLSQIDILFVIDNSEIQNTFIVEKIQRLKNVMYKWNHGNFGIAAALNLGAMLAIEQQSDYLLMMDQDSVVSSNLIKEYREYLSRYDTNSIGILYPYHIYKNYPLPVKTGQFQYITTADTSGSLLNLVSYKRIGRFMESLFIDYVDFEYCLRLRSHGYKIIQINNVILWQELGNMCSKKFLFWKVGISNHSPNRLYYRVRNRLFVASKYFLKYPIWSTREILFTAIEVTKIILYEAQKREKIKKILLGVFHFFYQKGWNRRTDNKY